jgi:hypothetical protein
MTDVTINSFADFKKSRDAYREFLKEQIAVNKTKANAVDLFNFNGSKPYYQPDIRSRAEKLSDKTFVRSDIINFMVQDKFLDFKEASAMVGELNDDYAVLLYKYYPLFAKRYKTFNRLYDGKEFSKIFILFLQDENNLKSVNVKRETNANANDDDDDDNDDGDGDGDKKIRQVKSRLPTRKSSRNAGMEGKGIVYLGIQPTPLYHQFGNKIINKSKLDNNILMMRYKNGINITKHPTKSVSKTFANIVRNMLIDKNPSYDDLDKLDEEEKSYLHEICSYCNVIDRFSIPTPNKNSDEKESDRFQLLIGQLKAGNNSKEMIKELKQLLIKFRTKRKLPIQEINEILMTLIEMGY